MKKLIMFAAIGVCCAVRAASFTWGSDSTVNELNTAESGYVSKGTTYYLFAVGSATDAISSFNKDTHQITVGGTTYSSVDSHVIGATDYETGAFSDVYADDASTINQNYYVVLFDADTAGNAGSGMFTVSGVTDTGTPPNYVSAIDASGIGTTANMVIPVTGGGTGGIPEPTSGLLLLVGGAMLALRRKRG